MIAVTVQGLAFEVPEPVGERALELFSAALGTCSRAGVLDAFVEVEDATDAARARALGRGAIALAGESSSLAVVRRTLVGGTIDGAPITAETYAGQFAAPGRYLAPYVAALVVWMRAGFFGAPAGSGSGESPEAPGRTGEH